MSVTNCYYAYQVGFRGIDARAGTNRQAAGVKATLRRTRVMQSEHRRQRLNRCEDLRDCESGGGTVLNGAGVWSPPGTDMPLGISGRNPLGSCVYLFRNERICIVRD